MSRGTSPLYGIIRLAYGILLTITLVFIAIYGVILFPLLIRAVLFKGNRWLRFLLQFVNTFLFMLSTFIFYIVSGNVISALPHIAAVGLYIMVALAHRLFCR
jgi:hypothetical protein